MFSVKEWLLVGGAISVYLLIGLRFRRVGRFLAYLFLFLPLMVLIVAIAKPSGITNEISSTDVLFSAIYAVLLILYLIDNKKHIPKKKVVVPTYTEPEFTGIDYMTGEEFEVWCASLLRANGFRDVNMTPKTGDQ